MFDKPTFFLYNTICVIVRCAMRLNVNRVLHTPDAGENFHFEMDLQDLEFGGEKPVINPVVVDGRVQNKAGVLLLELQTSTTPGALRPAENHRLFLCFGGGKAI